jgi:hypothetical protein
MVFEWSISRLNSMVSSHVGDLLAQLKCYTPFDLGS